MGFISESHLHLPRKKRDSAKGRIPKDKGVIYLFLRKGSNVSDVALGDKGNITLTDGLNTRLVCKTVVKKTKNELIRGKKLIDSIVHMQDIP